MVSGVILTHLSLQNYLARGDLFVIQSPDGNAFVLSCNPECRVMPQPMQLLMLHKRGTAATSTVQIILQTDAYWSSYRHCNGIAYNTTAMRALARHQPQLLLLWSLAFPSKGVSPKT